MDPLNDDGFLAQLRTRANAGEALKYVFFWGHRPGKNGVSAACFSQWYEAAFSVDGQVYPTAEHFMMAQKAALFADHATHAKVLVAATPGAAKALGREVAGFDEAVWLRERFAIVARANAAKFAQNPELAGFLRGTGQRILVEASPVDRVWGIGLAHDDARAQDPNQWLGLNLLGFALTEVRGGASGE